MVISYRVRFINTIIVDDYDTMLINIQRLTQTRAQAIPTLHYEHTDGDWFLSYRVSNSITGKTIQEHTCPRRDGGVRRPHRRGAALPLSFRPESAVL